ncbi:MAG: NUDIX hydrolase [Saprospirales bacterium]|nr:NUDIX hydrolase [Saprospirales bacterium]
MDFNKKYPNPWGTKRSDLVYDNPWLTVNHNEVINPSGNDGIYGVVHFKNLAIGIVPIDDAGYTWLVGQYRYTLGQYSWEIPEGGCPLGTDPLLSAKRELAEETGLEAQTWLKVLDLHTSNSVTDEAGMVFLAQGLRQGTPHPEDTEELKLARVPLSKALDLIHEGIITDALSIMGLYRVYWMAREGKITIPSPF